MSNINEKTIGLDSGLEDNDEKKFAQTTRRERFISGLSSSEVNLIQAEPVPSEDNFYQTGFADKVNQIVSQICDQ